MPVQLVKLLDAINITVSGAGVPDGTNTGDILRWNAGTSGWEVKAEPLDFTQINLTPAAAAILDQEGGLWYKSTDKSLYVCTEGS
jgi:hypothetical protein